MKHSDRITIVEPVIRIPAWRSVSPKNLSTRPRRTSPKTTRDENLTMSPKDATQSRGTAIQPISAPPSLDHRDLGMGCQQRLREHVVEREHAEEGDHDRLVHGSTHAFGTTGCRHALVATDHRDDGSEQGGLHDRPPEVGGTRVREQRREERSERRLEGKCREDASEDAEHQRVDVEEARDDHEAEEARHDEVLHRVDAEDLESVELLADLARAEVRRDCRAGNAGEDDCGHEWRELADRAQDEEAAEAVDRAEQDEEVAGLQTRGAVTERDRRDQQREPAQAQRKEELL